MSRTKLNFEKRQKSEARFGGVVTLQSQTTKVIGQRTTEEAAPTTDNRQQTTDNRQRRGLRRQRSTDLTTNYYILIKQDSNY